MRLLIAAAIAGMVSANAFAADTSGSDTPPKPTQTSTECESGMVWDKKTEKCVKADARILNDDDRYEAAREFAYAGKYEFASNALDAMTDQSASRVVTYRGFIARKAGDWSAAEGYYLQAIAQNPDNILARSYFGRGLVARGDLEAARIQLAEIRSRGGRETWSERALLMSLRSGNSGLY